MPHLRALKTAPQAFRPCGTKIGGYDDNARKHYQPTERHYELTRNTDSQGSEFKHVHSGASIDGLVDHLLAQNPDQADSITKNVCARIPVALAEEMEQLGGLIGLNKRQIITMAIVDFLEKANGVMNEFDAWPGEHTGHYELTAVEPIQPTQGA